MILQFTIPDVQAQRIINAMKNLYAIPHVLIDLNNPSMGTKPLFTDAQWAKECVRRWLIEQVQIHEYQKAMEQVVVSKDDSIVS